MEGFLEANRLVEASLNKFSCLQRRGRDSSLRKTLLISNVLNRAQDVATSAHMNLISSAPTPRGSSKLLASIASNNTDENDRLPALSPSGSVHVPGPAKMSHRPPSPIAASCQARTEDEEPMDFENIISNNSVLMDILSPADGSESGVASSENGCPLDRVKSPKPSNTTSPKKASTLKDVLNIRTWSASHTSRQEQQQEEHSSKFTYQPPQALSWSVQNHDHMTTTSTTSPPESPGKRHHSEAFPFDEFSALWGEPSDEYKRFKPSPPEGCQLESLPGFCGYLSPRNLQSAPLLTYMFGKGFASPGDPHSLDWPGSFHTSQSHDENSFFPSPSIQTSPVKFNPILAF